jgi:hypothetical protein
MVERNIALSGLFFGKEGYPMASSNLGFQVVVLFEAEDLISINAIPALRATRR